MESNNGRLRILFLCRRNSCRSQMAEGWARFLKAHVIEAHSAGTDPGSVDPRAIEVMAEVGVDLSTHRSKPVSDLDGLSFDYVITLCGSARETCPLFPGSAKVLHRGFEDPPALAGKARNEEEVLRFYRRVRDQIRVFVEGMPGNLHEGVQKGLDRS